MQYNCVFCQNCITYKYSIVVSKSNYFLNALHLCIVRILNNAFLIYIPT